MNRLEATFREQDLSGLGDLTLERFESLETPRTTPCAQNTLLLILGGGFAAPTCGAGGSGEGLTF